MANEKRRDNKGRLLKEGESQQKTEGIDSDIQIQKV